jgi:hypothetical protein
MINIALSITVAFMISSIGLLALSVAFAVLNDVLRWFPIY